jgi:hypothetical protein
VGDLWCFMRLLTVFTHEIKDSRTQIAFPALKVTDEGLPERFVTPGLLRLTRCTRQRLKPSRITWPLGVLIALAALLSVGQTPPDAHGAFAPGH